MSNPYQTAASRVTDGFRGRLIGVLCALVIANLAAWAWALSAFAAQPVLLGTALLAYGLGLRHALDADHIAAIDNATRKLMQDGKRPVTVGLFFALGHSAVVLIASLAVAFAATLLTDSFAAYRDLASLIGRSVSALFLFMVAIMNIAVLVGVYRAFRGVRGGKAIADDDIDRLLQQRGWLARLFRPLFLLLSRSWQLFPIGFLFALGFDTASEISLIGLSAQAINPASPWSILVFPALFAAGMTLVDTVDGVLMLGAYGWAYRNPRRKLLYNMLITSASVLVALVIGGVTLLDLIAEQLALEGRFWTSLGTLSSHYGLVGFCIVALFVASWLLSVMIYRLNGAEQREESTR